MSLSIKVKCLLKMDYSISLLANAEIVILQNCKIKNVPKVIFEIRAVKTVQYKKKTKLIWAIKLEKCHTVIFFSMSHFPFCTTVCSIANINQLFVDWNFSLKRSNRKLQLLIIITSKSMLMALFGQKGLLSASSN